MNENDKPSATARHHQVSVSFNVEAPTLAEARTVVDELMTSLTEDGSARHAASSGTRPALRGWDFTTPILVETFGQFEGTGVLDLMADMFEPEPAMEDFRLAGGGIDEDAFEDVHADWREQCLDRAIAAAQLPQLLGRLDSAEHTVEAITEVLEHYRKPAEPQRDHYEDWYAFHEAHHEWRDEYLTVSQRCDEALTQALHTSSAGAVPAEVPSTPQRPGTGDVERTSESSEPRPAVAGSQGPERVSVGVITWTDLDDEDPTILVDTNPVRLARNLATTLYENLDGNPAFDGAAAFLDTHLSPEQWHRPEDVDAWLDAFDQVTPLPAISIQSVGVGAPPPGTAPEETPRTPAGPVTAVGVERTAASPAEDEELFTYRVPLDVEVSARTRGEAEQMVDDALTGNVEPGTPAVVERGQRVRPDGDVAGLLGWQHTRQGQGRSADSDTVGAMLEARVDRLDGTEPQRSRPDSGPETAWRRGL